MTFATRLDVTPSPAGSTSGQNTNQTSKRPRPCFQHNAVQNETVKHKLKTKQKGGKKKERGKKTKKNLTKSTSSLTDCSQLRKRELLKEQKNKVE